MTNEELVKLIQTANSKGKDCKELLLQLWNQNRGLCYKIALRYASTAPLDDLLQESFLAVHRAAHTFSETGGDFFPFAAKVIQNQLIRYLSENGYAIRLPEWLRGALGQYRRITNETKIRTGKEPTQQELCEQIGVSLDTLETIRAADRMTQARSLSEIVGGEDGDIILEDTIADQDVNIEADSIDKEFLSELRKDLEAEISKLKKDQREIILQRYLGFDIPTFQQIADRIGEPVQAVRNKEAMGMRRLRDNSRTGRLKQYMEELTYKRQAMAYRGSLARFQMTGTSSTERAALYHFDDDRQQARDLSPL